MRDMKWPSETVPMARLHNHQYSNNRNYAPHCFIILLPITQANAGLNVARIKKR
jgi:hypothetical protein